MVDFTLSESQLELRRVAREFARKEIRPIAGELDRNPDPAQSFARDLYPKANALGFNTALVQEAYGGAGLGDLDFAIILEELAWGDVGVALTYVGHWLALAPLIRGGSDDQRRRWLPQIAASPDKSFLAAICATEHGSGRRPDAARLPRRRRPARRHRAAGLLHELHAAARRTARDDDEGDPRRRRVRDQRH